MARAIQEATITLDAQVSAQACSQGGRSSAIQTLKGSKGVQAIAEAVARAYTNIAGGMQFSNTSCVKSILRSGFSLSLIVPQLDYSITIAINKGSIPGKEICKIIGACPKCKLI